MSVTAVENVLYAVWKNRYTMLTLHTGNTGMFFQKPEPVFICLMMDHINSYSRESLGNKCPYDVFSFLYGQEMPAYTGGIY